MTPKLICDTREPIDRIKEIILYKNYDLNLIKFKALHLGDYCIEKNGKRMLIERKEISDLINSIYSKGSSKGTLKQKLTQMKGLSDDVALLVEGDYGLHGEKIYVNKFVPQLKYAILARFLDHRQNEGIKIIYTHSFSETIMRLILIMLDKKEISICKLNWDQLILAIPGIGPKGLNNIKTKYVSPKVAFQNIEEWAKMDLENW